MRYRITFKRTLDASQQNRLNRMIYKELDSLPVIKYTAEPGPENEIQMTFKSEQEYTLFCLQWNPDNVEHLQFIPLGTIT